MAGDRKSAPKPVRNIGRSAAPATTVVIALCSLVYVLQFVPGLGVTQHFLYAGIYSAPGNFEPWRMLTSAFVHSTGMVFHILLNMYTLWIFGRMLEPYIGTARFVSLYLVSAWAGSVGVLWFAGLMTPVVGASGAIFGVIGAFIVIHRSVGGSSPQLYVLLAINLAIGFLPGTAIAWEAHVGGLIAGTAVGLIYSRTRRVDQQRLQKLAVAAVAVALVVLSLRLFLLA